MNLARQVIAFAANIDGEYVTIGGGEPTLHPNFWEILGLCLGNFENVWMATNGTQTGIAVSLANMAKKGVLGVALSLDRYHDSDMVDPRVHRAFGSTEVRSLCGANQNSNDLREIRTVPASRLIKAGRCTWGIDECCCDDLIIMPDGRIKMCGCDHAHTVGRLPAGFFSDDFMQWYQENERPCSKRVTRLSDGSFESKD